ncbi:response regulator [Chryseobacterium nematophagum]|uniref:histidine kinase n=1 Tax=Chryseobacterium nematophagum TaxID=2305228 RepID=A0A3M7LC97_9FLAO|nr:response regulator [Chryseobacterium nematophagum]RMZ59849.1 response regulator [Chryseobacterium nematophagum]
MPKKIIRNLQFGVGISLLILIASSIASYWSIQNQMQNKENLSTSRRSITAVKDILVTLLDAETGARGYQLTGKKSFLEPYNHSVDEFPEVIRQAKLLDITDQEQLQRIKDLEQNGNKIFINLKQFIENKQNGIQMTQEHMLLSKQYADQCRQLVFDFVHYEENQLAKKDKALRRSSNLTVLFIVFSALAALTVTVFFYRKLRKDLMSKERLQRELKEKEQEMTKRVSTIQKVANRIAFGDYSQKIEDNSQDDLSDLADSVNDMTASLKKSFDKINKSDWRQKGWAILNESLVGNKSMDELIHESLDHLIEYGNCMDGAIYLMDEGLLKLSKAFGTKNSMPLTFKPGEGIVGKVFIQKVPKVYNDINEKDFVVSFASNKVKINAVLLLPILADKSSIGVLELCSAHNFDEDHLEYFVESSRNIGIALNAAKGREKEHRLLEETQAQSEELQVQHYELENLNSELEAQTQKLQASEEELRVQQEELMQANVELEERSKLLEEKNYMIADRNTEIQQKVEELALSTKYKSEFLANMSHELRTPLNSILLLSRLMSENTEENLNEDQVESAKVIHSSGSILLTLIDEILDLAKIESGKMKLEYQEVKMTDLIKSVTNLFNPLMNEKGIQFNVHIEKDVEKVIETDPLRVDQVLNNLLSNALKFTSEGNIDLHIKKDPENKEVVIFSVKDTGIGIPEDKQNVIFEAFRQADGSTRRKFGGTGLGLAISREITRMLGGELLLKSKVNVGSEFSFIVPINKGSKIPQIETDEDLVKTIKEDVEEIQNILHDGEFEVHGPNSVIDIPSRIVDDRKAITVGDKVILIVEDDVNFAKALLTYAHTQNYKGVVIDRGDKVLSAALQYQPSAILLDAQLPIKDGWQVMDELKSNIQTGYIPIHMMSALHVKEESLMKGATGFIDKPVAMNRMAPIFKKIEEALESQPQKVLIVEENTKHANALSYFLGNYHLTLSVENNAEDSIKSLLENNADCVILDTEKCKGKEAQIVQSIKSCEGLENLPVIVFTEHHLSQSEELRIKQYANSVVVKTAHSYQRILDEIGLFLHLVEKTHHSVEPTMNRTLGSLTEVLSEKKILITDDDTRNIFSLTKVLERYKVEVVPAMDGKQALDKIKEHPDIDVILMDLMMPEMDGYETIREIRKIPKLNQLPIIAITAKSMTGEREKCIEAGASDYISKPLDIDQLLSLLRVWLYES